MVKVRIDVSFEIEVEDDTMDDVAIQEGVEWLLSEKLGATSITVEVAS